MRIPFPFTLKVGADIVLRSRIARFANADPSRLRRFVAKLLHPAEVVELDRRFPTWHEAREQTLTRQAGLVSFLAGRWTAKEAAKKAWGASILSFKDLRVEVSEEEGDVQVVCSIAIPTSPEQIEQVARLSISHDGEYAIAVVIASPLDPVSSASLDQAFSIMPGVTEKLFQHRNYEQDPRAALVDAYTTSHLLAPSRNKFHDALTHAYHHTLNSGLPDISCSPTQGKFLAIQTRIAGAKNVLEVGTLGGYSGIWFASAGMDVKVTSVEVDPHHKKVAEENFTYAGVSDRVQVLLGPGLEVLPKLVEEVKAGKRERFDFVFIDADKENNLNYFNLALEMTKPGSCLYVDNIVRKGLLVDEEAIKQGQAGVIGARKLIEAVGQDERVEAVVLQTVSEKNYDGFLMAVAK